MVRNIQGLKYILADIQVDPVVIRAMSKEQVPSVQCGFFIQMELSQFIRTGILLLWAALSADGHILGGAIRKVARQASSFLLGNFSVNLFIFL